MKLDEKKAQVVKETVKKVLEAISKEKDEIEKHQKNLRVLKADLKDLELGRLDLIRERQEVDAEAKTVSMVDLKQIYDAVYSCNLASVTNENRASSLVSASAQGTYRLDDGTVFYIGRGYK